MNRNILNLRHLTVLLMLCTAFLGGIIPAFAQQGGKKITGQVIDENKEPMIGVSILIVGTSTGTVTDFDGNYTLNVPQGSKELQFSYVGYETKVVPVPANSTTLNIQLKSDSQVLSDVVVIGYGTQRKSDLTGSVTNVSSKDFNMGLVSSPEQLINGKISGVQIMSNSGSPTAGSTIRVRGGASLNASNDPLIVLDGVPLEQGGISGNDGNFLSLINPNDIESMTILKDASSTAIYGSRASNGVILITTKKGSSDKLKITFSTTNSVQTRTKLADMLSYDEFVNTIQSKGTDAQRALLGTTHTDWNDEIYQNAFGTDNNLSVAGKITKNPHIIITGATGQGKSFLAQIIFLSVALQNVKTLYIDPKRELRNHYQEVINSPEFARRYPERKKQIDNFNFVTLDSSLPSNHGVLDPIVVLDKEQAVEVAKNMLEFLLQAVDDVTMDQKTAITEAINAIVERRVAGENVGFKHVLEDLRQASSSEIASVGRYLTSIVTNSILELAFSDGSTPGLNYESRVTILEVNNLKLPKDDSTKISDHERNSIALMFALGAFCTHFGERNENEDTIEFFDEAWILMKSAEGKAVIKNMRRIGRSKNNTLALITQSVHDAENDDDTTGFGTIFAFYEKSEREDILRHVNLEVTESNLEWIDNMISGQCLYYDVYGNLNMISVHNLFEDIDMLLKPMKATVSSSLENKYAS